MQAQAHLCAFELGWHSSAGLPCNSSSNASDEVQDWARCLLLSGSNWRQSRKWAGTLIASFSNTVNSDRKGASFEHQMPQAIAASLSGVLSCPDVLVSSIPPSCSFRMGLRVIASCGAVQFALFPCVQFELFHVIFFMQNEQGGQWWLPRCMHVCKGWGGKRPMSLDTLLMLAYGWLLPAQIRLLECHCSTCGGPGQPVISDAL